jgi:hypothetical protein
MRGSEPTRALRPIKCSYHRTFPKVRVLPRQPQQAKVAVRSADPHRRRRRAAYLGIADAEAAEATPESALLGRTARSPARYDPQSLRRHPCAGRYHISRLDDQKLASRMAQLVASLTPHGRKAPVSPRCHSIFRQTCLRPLELRASLQRNTAICRGSSAPLRWTSESALADRRRFQS